MDLQAMISLKFNLVRIRLTNEGYTDGGHYYGAGQPLWNAISADASYDLWFRAKDRDAAKEHVRKAVPNATFFN